MTTLIRIGTNEKSPMTKGASSSQLGYVPTINRDVITTFTGQYIDENPSLKKRCFHTSCGKSFFYCFAVNACSRLA